jgi:acyl carrier protein
MNEKFISELAEALEIEVSDISPEDSFREYESYSSLTELSVLAMLDSEFGIELEMKEFVQYITVKDLMKLVADRSSM